LQVLDAYILAKVFSKAGSANTESTSSISLKQNILKSTSFKKHYLCLDYIFTNDCISKCFVEKNIQCGNISIWPGIFCLTNFIRISNTASNLFPTMIKM